MLKTGGIRISGADRCDGHCHYGCSLEEQVGQDRRCDLQPTMGEDATAKALAAVKVTTGLRPLFVDGAKKRDWIEGDAGTIAPLIHATDFRVFDDQRFRHHVTRSQFDDQVTAAAAAGTRGKVGMSGNAFQDDRLVDDWRRFLFRTGEPGCPDRRFLARSEWPDALKTRPRAN